MSDRMFAEVSSERVARPNDRRRRTIDFLTTGLFRRVRDYDRKPSIRLDGIGAKRHLFRDVARPTQEYYCIELRRRSDGPDILRTPRFRRAFAPVISRFSASPTSVSAGQSATLSWASSSDDYNLILPSIGPVGGTSIVVTPSATATYMLYSINQYGRTTASVSVTFH
jgi:hypothetical protein